MAIRQWFNATNTQTSGNKKPSVLGQNERGSVILLVILLPLFLVIFLSLAALGLMLKWNSQADHLCRQYLLQSQKHVINSTQKLLFMNQQAKLLRQQKKQAKLALQMALMSRTPPAIAAAKTHLTAITAQQVFFRGGQLHIISQLKLKNLNLKRALNSKLEQIIFLKKIHITNNAFALTTYPTRSLSPSYKADIGFSKKQQHKASWQLDLTSVFKKLPLEIQKMNKQCLTTIHRKARTWTSQIIEGKSFLNF